MSIAPWKAYRAPTSGTRKSETAITSKNCPRAGSGAGLVDLKHDDHQQAKGRQRQVAGGRPAEADRPRSQQGAALPEGNGGGQQEAGNKEVGDAASQQRGPQRFVGTTCATSCGGNGRQVTASEHWNTRPAAANESTTCAWLKTLPRIQGLRRSSTRKLSTPIQLASAGPKIRRHAKSTANPTVVVAPPRGSVTGCNPDQNGEHQEEAASSRGRRGAACPDCTRSLIGEPIEQAVAARG